MSNKVPENKTKHLTFSASHLITGLLGLLLNGFYLFQVFQWLKNEQQGAQTGKMEWHFQAAIIVNTVSGLNDLLKGYFTADKIGFQ